MSDKGAVETMGFYKSLSAGKSPVIDSWMFMSSPTPMLLLFAFYLLVVLVIGPAFMRNRKAYDLNNVTRAYNLFQIVACATAVKKFLQIGFTFKDNFDCSVIFSDEFTTSLLGWWYIMGYVRVIELIETVFFILRKKQNQASVLHIYHHIGSIFGAFITLKYDANARWLAHGVINCSVHVMMYAYYFLSSYRRFRKFTESCKPYITIIQIVQLIFICGHSFYFSFAPCGSKFFLTQACNTLLLNYLFIKFYIDSYKKKKE